MKSTLSIKGMALVLLIFFIGASLLCYLFLYRPKIIKAVKGTKETASLERRLEGKNQELKKIREEIEVNKKGGSRDYFNRYQIPPKDRETTFLKIHNELVKGLEIKTETVKPDPKQETPEYVRYPFLVETKSKYEEIVKFVDSLENSLGLNVGDLHIQNDPKDPLWHRLKFTVSTFELKGAESPVSPVRSEGGTPPLEVTVRDDIRVKRDPFLEKETEKRIISPEKPKERPRGLALLKLDGIIHIGSTKVAIINGTVVREGDSISNHRILQIGEEEVITLYRGKERILKIEDLIKTQKR
jgi:Tfp pilus assembly protein PilO